MNPVWLVLLFPLVGALLSVIWWLDLLKSPRTAAGAPRRRLHRLGALAMTAWTFGSAGFASGMIQMMSASPAPTTDKAYGFLSNGRMIHVNGTSFAAAWIVALVGTLGFLALVAAVAVHVLGQLRLQARRG